MVLKRYCGHNEDVEEPENGETFLMERGRYCRKCKNAFKPAQKSAETGRDKLPRPMAMARDLWNE